jgi:hypothetical protein
MKGAGMAMLCQLLQGNIFPEMLQQVMLPLLNSGQVIQLQGLGQGRNSSHIAQFPHDRIQQLQYQLVDVEFIRRYMINGPTNLPYGQYLLQEEVVQVIKRCITVDHQGMNIVVLQKPSRLLRVVADDLLKKLTIKFKSSGGIGLAIDMPDGMRKCRPENQYATGMYILQPPESAVFKKSGLYEVEAKAVVVLGLTDGTDIAMAFIPGDLVYIRRKQYANITEHLFKVTKHMAVLKLGILER